MSLKVIKAGVADTIQDSGRYGWQHLGINPNGVMDRFSAAIANILVGNHFKSAVIELHFPSSVFLFQKPTLIALAGANFSATINGEPLSLYQPVLVNKNSILQFHEPKAGARVYLALNGNFQISKWLNSYSTNMKAEAGGFEGRAFQKNDEVEFNLSIDFSETIANDEFVFLPWRADPARGDDSREILFSQGNEWEWLTEESKLNFQKQSFVITPNSDRMGYRLSAELLHTTTHDELVSSSVSFGTIQLLPDGRLILLMADHQTTGGYPRVAHVITAHLPRLAQMKPGDMIHFKQTDIKNAEALLWKQHQHLNLLREACTVRLNEFLHDRRK